MIRISIAAFALAVGCTTPQWPATNQPSLDGPLDGLEWTMSWAEGRRTARTLAGGMSLDTSVEDWHAQTAWTPWIRASSSSDVEPIFDQARWRASRVVVGDLAWTLDFDIGGLRSVGVRFPSEEEALARLTQAWGPGTELTTGERLWNNSAGGTRAVLRECSGQIGPEHPGGRVMCVSLLPYQPLEDLIDEAIIGRIGASRDELPPRNPSAKYHWLPSTGYAIALTAQRIDWEADEVVGSRTELSYFLAPVEERDQVKEALVRRLGSPEISDEDCPVWPSASVRACYFPRSRSWVVDAGRRAEWPLIPGSGPL